MSRKVVITGIGLVTPLAVGAEETWAALLAGRSGAAPLTLFDPSGFGTTFACEVKAWDPSPWLEPPKARGMDRFIQFAVAAGDMAFRDAGLELTDEERERTGCFVGVGMGGIGFLEANHAIITRRGPRRVSPYMVPGMIPNLAPGQISMRFDLRGPNFAHASACSSGAHAIGEAFHWIRRGDADVMLAGGAESTVTPLGVAGFNQIKALSKRNDAPERASRPFDAERDGFVIGEGAGVLVLEAEERARARGARIYAEVAGFGATADAYHVTAPAPEGRGAQACMRMALRSAGLPPEAIDHVNAHGTSTKLNDELETVAIRRVFGEHADRLAVSSNKSMLGHLLGAAGGVETAITALTIQRRVVPPTINYETPDPACDLDYVPNQPREMRVRAAISNSFGFGGTNACLVLREHAAG